jgi:hypothetical protein
MGTLRHFKLSSRRLGLPHPEDWMESERAVRDTLSDIPCRSPLHRHARAPRRTLHKVDNLGANAKKECAPWKPPCATSGLAADESVRPARTAALEGQSPHPLTIAARRMCGERGEAHGSQSRQGSEHRRQVSPSSGAGAIKVGTAHIRRRLLVP